MGLHAMERCVWFTKCTIVATCAHPVQRGHTLLRFCIGQVHSACFACSPYHISYDQQGILIKGQ